VTEQMSKEWSIRSFALDAGLWTSAAASEHAAAGGGLFVPCKLFLCDPLWVWVYGAALLKLKLKLLC